MGKIWELDFYSRPVLDERQKKRWEVLVCETPLSVEAQPDQLFRYSKFCSNTEVNSVWLQEALKEAIAESDSSPTQIRFFRRQMNNMITRTCKELGIDPKPSRRTVALHQWLQERHIHFYPQQPGYQASSNPSVTYAPPTAQSLPDAIQGQRWAFVTLQAQDFAEMPDWDIGFSEAFPLDLVGLPPETRIPGVIVFSSRATPLAGWMSGLELAYLWVEESDRPRLILETGASDSWVLADLKSTTIQAEAKGFQAAKAQANGVHFLAVQANPESDAFAGFWLMQELNLA